MISPLETAATYGQKMMVAVAVVDEGVLAWPQCINSCICRDLL